MTALARHRDIYNSYLASAALGALVGIVLHTLLFVLSMVQYAGFEYMGVQDSSTVDQVVAMFSDTVWLLSLKILAIHWLVGAILGTALGLWLALLSHAVEWRMSKLRLTAFLTVGLLIVHLGFLWYAMAKFPQPFIDAFYNANAFGYLFQLIPSAWLPPALFQALASLFLATVPVMLAFDLRRKWGTRQFMAVFTMGIAIPLTAASIFLLWTTPSDTNRYRIHEALDKPNVLIIAGDSLRPDYVSRSGLGGFDRMKAEGVNYTNAYTVFPRTFPAWMSILTGQYPARHAIRNMFPGPAQLAQRYDSLPRILGDAGYKTGVFSDFAGDIFARIDLGFQHIEVPEFSLKSNVRLGVWKLHVHLLPYLLATGAYQSVPELQGYERLADPKQVSNRFLRWMSHGDKQLPFFAVLFYSTPHFPYSAPYPYYRMNHVDGYTGPHRFCKVGTGASQAPDEEDIKQIRGNFMAGTQAVDAELGRILTYLDDTGTLDNTLVIVTSDHGENLFEGDIGNSHGDVLYKSNSLKVPFLWHFPKNSNEGTSLDDLVSHLDLAPTVLSVVGLDTPSWMEGRNLNQPDFRPRKSAPLFAETGLVFVDPDSDVLHGKAIRYGNMVQMFETDPLTSELYLSPAYQGDAILAKHRMVLAPPYKLLYIPTRTAPLFECYDLDADPEETTPLDMENTAECIRMKEELYRFAKEGGEQVVEGYILP